MDLKLNVNGVDIPDEGRCRWCGGVLERRGSTHVGVGVNSFTLWCKQCGAIEIHAHDFSRKITGFNIEYKFKK